MSTPRTPSHLSAVPLCADVLAGTFELSIKPSNDAMKLAGDLRIAAASPPLPLARPQLIGALGGGRTPMSPMACFACLPGLPAGPEPRMLCPDHKSTCVLADGTSLHTALERVKPPDAPLEGSSLGWLYNPVSVIDSAGHRQRGWTSFAGGGMAVLEDRFDARDPFELWMCERTDMVEILKVLSPVARAPSESTGSLNNSLRPRFLTAYQMWEWYRVVQERRAELGHWPASFAELVKVLASPDSSPSLTPSGEAIFLAVLADIAKNRLGSSRAPA